MYRSVLALAVGLWLLFYGGPIVYGITMLIVGGGAIWLGRDVP